jgi:hypothetical protein
MQHDQNQKATLADAQAELRQGLLSLAIVLNDIYGGHALRTVLKLEDSKESDDYIALNDADVTSLRLYQLLPEAFDYAFRGRGSEVMRVQVFESPSYFDQLSDFLQMIEGNLSIECVDFEVSDRGQPWRRGSLRALIDTGLARASLDSGVPLSAGDLALLAEMTERSVQNAFSLQGAGHLPATKQDGVSYVDNADAKRWLSNRKSFTPTVWTSFDGNSLPEELGSQPDLRSFLRARLHAIYGGASDKIRDGIAIPEEQLVRKLHGDLRVELGDASALARGLHLDERWLVTTVFRINHPKEAKLLLAAPATPPRMDPTPRRKGNTTDKPRRGRGVR